MCFCSRCFRSNSPSLPQKPTALASSAWSRWTRWWMRWSTAATPMLPPSPSGRTAWTSRGQTSWNWWKPADRCWRRRTSCTSSSPTAERYGRNKVDFSSDRFRVLILLWHADSAFAIFNALVTILWCRCWRRSRGRWSSCQKWGRARRTSPTQPPCRDSCTPLSMPFSC